jgi:hypothetical protein
LLAGTGEWQEDTGPARLPADSLAYHILDRIPEACLIAYLEAGGCEVSARERG